MKNLNQLLAELKELSDYFYAKGIEDIYTNSKIYEVLMAYSFNHEIVNGHAYTSDAMDQLGNMYEYKHFKLSSSNHSWTFNDFSDKTIEQLNKVHNVYFSVINDSYIYPRIIKTYSVSGRNVAKYLELATLSITNTRKMINISEVQIKNNMDYELIPIKNRKPSNALFDVFYTAHELEQITKIRGILTSNKLWELLVGIQLNHSVNSNQKKYDASDEFRNTYEYKVSSNARWTFQDISENVLDSYLYDNCIILAVVNKKDFLVEKIYACKPFAVVSILKSKLSEKINNNKEIKRLSAGIGIRDVNYMIENGDAEWVL